MTFGKKRAAPVGRTVGESPMRSIRMTYKLGNASYILRRCLERAANKESTIESI